MSARAVVGVIWFPISYLGRFYMVVLIEPGINPIKFPVSSVAAKFIYPFGVLLTGWFAGVLEPVRGQSHRKHDAGDDRRTRRNHGAVAAAGFSFRHRAQTLCPPAPGRTP